MGARRGRGRWLCGAILVATFMAMGIAPVAAATNLNIGGQAIVSGTSGDGVNVRDAVGYNAKVLLRLPEGATVKVIGGPNTASDGSRWYNVDVNGTLGWIISDYLSLPPTKSGQVLTVSGTNGDGLRLRDAASLNSSTITVMPDGAQVTAVGADVTDGGGNVWSNVSYDGQTGFAARGFLATSAVKATVVQVSDPAPTQSSGIQVGGNSQVANTDGDGLNLRADVGFGAAVITVAAEGDVVHVIDGPRKDGSGQTWWGVDYKGTKGWMIGQYLTATDKQPTQAASAAAASPAQQAQAPAASTIGDKIAATAMKYVGYPYVWGGTTPAGFDCSGFLYFVVNQVTGGGFSRTLEVQATSGVYVDPKDLQPGDLVFQQNTYKWGLSHSGIYLGNGKFISASNESTGVIIYSLWDSYWGPRFYTARRITQ